ncbi:MAG: transglycosylase SLT domain-containing protein [Candidatus Accumulibacter sp.]|nr:transglycosylase SLT domain-containing protein [Accumulibacter sp.]
MKTRRARFRDMAAMLPGMAVILLWPSVCAANSGTRLSPESLNLLRMEARSYEHGEGVLRDPRRAASLYCDAARYGDAESQFSLGWMYANGRGVERDDGVASAFFQLAARQGHEESRKMLRFVGDAAASLPDCMNTAKKPAEDDYTFRADNPAQRRIFGLVRRLAPEYGVSPRLVMAVIRAESNFEPAAISPKNAQGLMQLVPETSARFNVRRPFDPEQNIRGGMAYLRWLLAYFEGNVPLVAAAYNAGEGAVERYRGIPPYAETRDYVGRILRLFQKNEHPFDPRVTAPSPELPRIRRAGGPRGLSSAKNNDAQRPRG